MLSFWWPDHVFDFFKRFFVSKISVCLPLTYRKAIASSPKRHYLMVEHLEARCLLSTVNWIKPTGGDWDTPANWLDASTGTNHVPTVNDDAVISVSGITV